MRPDVSIVMPMLNGQRYIAGAVRSTCNQTSSNYELMHFSGRLLPLTREFLP